MQNLEVLTTTVTEKKLPDYENVKINNAGCQHAKSRSSDNNSH